MPMDVYLKGALCNNLSQSVCINQVLLEICEWPRLSWLPIQACGRFI